MLPYLHTSHNLKNHLCHEIQHRDNQQEYLYHFITLHLNITRGHFLKVIVVVTIMSPTTNHFIYTKNYHNT